jgi:hypothetical protein
LQLKSLPAILSLVHLPEMCAYMSMSGSSRSTAPAAHDGVAATRTATNNGQRKRIVMSGSGELVRVGAKVRIGSNRMLPELFVLSMEPNSGKTGNFSHCSGKLPTF